MNNAKCENAAAIRDGLYIFRSRIHRSTQSPGVRRYFVRLLPNRSLEETLRSRYAQYTTHYGSANTTAPLIVPKVKGRHVVVGESFFLLCYYLVFFFFLLSRESNVNVLHRSSNTTNTRAHTNAHNFTRLITPVVAQYTISRRACVTYRAYILYTEELADSILYSRTTGKQFFRHLRVRLHIHNIRNYNVFQCTHDNIMLL